MMNWLKKLIQNLEKKIEDVDKKTLNTSKFIVTQDFNKF